MGKINRALLMAIAMVAIMIAAVGINKGVEYYSARRWEKERVQHYEQAYADILSYQMTLSELSRDPQALEAFIEENKEYFEEDEAGITGMGSSVSENAAHTPAAGEVSGNSTDSVSGNDTDGVSGNSTGSVSGNGLEDVSGNAAGVSSNRLEGVWDNQGDQAGDVSDNREDTSENMQDASSGELTLADRRKIRSSYMETIERNKEDLEIIQNSEVDFSEISIACLGDSITAAANLEGMEDYQQYAYPQKLKELLNAGSVENFGIGGSSIGRYWQDAFVDRYQEIPKDTDLILVMGGTNDGFCVHQEDLGSFEERKERTFYGDLDQLMKGLREDYPEATIVFATPLPNVLHDMLRKERDYLLPQSVLATAIRQLAQEYDIPVIDLYNSNILDTHDAAVIYNYMPDGVHCNPVGYEVLAEHFAAELIRLYSTQQEQEEKNV